MEKLDPSEIERTQVAVGGSRPSQSPPPPVESQPLIGRATNVDKLVRHNITATAAKAFRSNGNSVHEAAKIDPAMPELEKGFLIEEKMAEGGQGIIHTAKDLCLQRRVAVKSLRPECRQNPGFVQSFLREAGLTAQLDHPSIIPFYSMNTDQDKGLHLIMKLIHGRTLRAYLDDVSLYYRSRGIRNFDEIEAMRSRLEYFIKVCEAVSYAHDHGVIHRDLKPDNIMIGEYGEVYVMDWGIAATLEDIEKMSDDQIRSGTVGYIPPEVFRESIVGEKTDIFALGAILFELVTLKRAYSGNSVIDVLDRTAQGLYEPLEHAFRSVTIPGDIRAVIDKALNPEPGQRYDSVKELRDDVRRFLHGLEVSARPDNVARAAVRWIFRHRQLSLTVFLGVLLGLAALIIVQQARQVRFEHQARVRQLFFAHLQHDVNTHAHNVDRHILRLEAMLTRFAEKAALLLTLPDSSTTRPIPFLGAPELAALQASPAPSHPGIVFSPVYAQAISLDQATWQAAPGCDNDELRRELAKLALLDGAGFLRKVVESDPDIDFDPKRIGEYKRDIAEKGFPLRSLYLGLASGAIVCYPGISSFGDEYDPRERPWYKGSAENDSVTWTKPYYDAWGGGLVLSASIPIRSRAGTLLGVASLDITLAYISRELINRDRDKSTRERRLLVTQDGHILLDSDLAGMEDASKEAVKGELELVPYPRPEILDLLRNRKGGQKMVETPEGTLVIAVAPISGTRSFYVIEIPLQDGTLP